MGSYILAAVILGMTVLAAVGTAITMRSETRRFRRVAVPLGLLAGGSAFAWFAFTINRQMEVTTLHEAMLEGSSDVKQGQPAPVRQTSFDVEHPGVEHELFYSPSGGSEDFTAEVAVKLLDPAGEVMLQEQHAFIPERSGRGRRFDPLRWQGRTLSFRPKQQGTYRVLVTPLTIGVQGIHVRIADPEKTDGQRMPGY
jgi:hypothetical protein